MSLVSDMLKRLEIESPIITYCKPDILRLTEEQCDVLIPLSHATKSHINTMGFGPLSIGADLTGGLLVFYHGQYYDKALNFCFSKAIISFLRKPTTDVLFTCLDGALIKQTLDKAYQMKKGLLVDIRVLASMQKEQRIKRVAEFILTLYVEYTTGR